MLWSGLSAVIGSWKIMAMRSPRNCRIVSSPRPTSSRSSNRIDPETCAPSGVRAISASAVIVLLEPDSPTTPRLSPSPSENDVRSTTRCNPLGVPTSTASSETSSSMSAPGLQFRIERVAQSVAKQVETQNAERDRNARIERESGGVVEDVLGVGEHLAPRGLRRLRAEAEIRERRLGENGDRELNRRLHDQRGRNVGQDMIDGDRDRSTPRSASGERVFTRKNAIGGGARKLRDDRHVVDADRDDRVDDARAESRSQHDRQEERRKRKDEVAELHESVFDEALGERRDEAEDDPEREANADRDDANQNGDARARQNLRSDVASEIVGAEPVRRGWRGELVGNVDRGRRIGRPDERQQGGGDQRRDEYGSEPQAQPPARAKPGGQGHAAEALSLG